MESRSKSREKIITILYQKYIYDGGKVNYLIDDVINENAGDNPFVRESVKKIIENEENILNLANTYLKDWTINRLSKVDKAILSLATYELLYTGTNFKVVINEAINLAKIYSDEKVVKMINATLDKMYHNEVKDE